MEQKVNKCQFCGGIAKVAGRKLRYVTCTSCHAQGPRCALVNDAIAGWNSIKKGANGKEIPDGKIIKKEE